MRGLDGFRPGGLGITTVEALKTFTSLHCGVKSSREVGLFAVH